MKDKIKINLISLNILMIIVVMIVCAVKLAIRLILTYVQPSTMVKWSLITASNILYIFGAFAMTCVLVDNILLPLYRKICKAVENKLENNMD